MQQVRPPWVPAHHSLTHLPTSIDQQTECVPRLTCFLACLPVVVVAAPSIASYIDDPADRELDVITAFLEDVKDADVSHAHTPPWHGRPARQMAADVIWLYLYGCAGREGALQVLA